MDVNEEAEGEEAGAEAAEGAGGGACGVLSASPILCLSYSAVRE